MNNIAKARNRGYFIELHYIGVERAEIAKERVAGRMKQGCHGFAEQDIERRYRKKIQKEDTERIYRKNIQKEYTERIYRKNIQKDDIERRDREEKQ